MAKPFLVKTFRQLVEHTARLSYKNKDHLLFYRGQTQDYINKANSSAFYPSIYRGDYLPGRELVHRFNVLEGAGKSLVQVFEREKVEGYKELKRRKAVQWSILQHYEVCATPYLDFTQSLRVACSFAMLDNSNPYAYVYVFGLPYLTNRISVNSEHDLVNIRLLSICPPTALRPYFQEGYLAGTDDITTSYEVKTELDFNNRLIAKFLIPNQLSFWESGFSMIPRASLYPDNDPIFDLCEPVRDKVARELLEGDPGEFLKELSAIEVRLKAIKGVKTHRITGVRESGRMLKDHGTIEIGMDSQIVKLRNFRNALIHTPEKVTSKQLEFYQSILERIQADIQHDAGK
ncbi:MAG: hypothetical protein A2X11_01980 [Bacteroidetes bacterium GWE2_42_24]|nr:MAG: hypothetical protein A2X11_01980 [Bacteroidetes bacterium GWE2_42_24]OFY28719.1 MAG: hypothetical protein A2X09_12165 [Bacteroidetes bacterium GWF2_43_11]